MHTDPSYITKYFLVQNTMFYKLLNIIITAINKSVWQKKIDKDHLLHCTVYFQLNLKYSVYQTRGQH